MDRLTAKLTDPAREATRLAIAGSAFLVLAAFFLWRDLALPRELVVLGATALAGIAAALGWPRGRPALGAAALLVATVAAGVWFLTERAPGILPALGVALIAAGVAVWRDERDAAAPTSRASAHHLRWYALGAAALACSWGLYFHFLTLGAAGDSVARRLIPTLAWLALGLAFLVTGRRRPRLTAAAETGLGLMAVALGKAVFYDTTHLHGPLRVAVLAAVGVMLLFGARILRAAPEGAT